MSELVILFAQFLGALFVVILAGMILAKLHLLPGCFVRDVRAECVSGWAEAERRQVPYHPGCAAPVRRLVVGALDLPLWRQEERAARGYLLATARPMYEITEDGEYIPIRYDDD